MKRKRTAKGAASLVLAASLAFAGAAGIVGARAIVPSEMGLVRQAQAATKTIENKGIYYPMSAGMYFKNPVFSKGKITFQSGSLAMDSGRTWKTRFKSGTGKERPAPVEGMTLALKTTSKTKYYTYKGKTKNPATCPKKAKKTSLAKFKKFVKTKAAPAGKYLYNGVYFEVKGGKATNVCVALYK